MNFTEEQLILGINFIKQNGFHDVLLDLKLPNKWDEQKSITLDNFSLYKGTYIIVDNKVLTNNNDALRDYKFELESLINTGSCYGLSCYIYALIKKIQNK
jgi:hypothetical protein